jgi:anthranilate phosphoribosyltransferase
MDEISPLGATTVMEVRDGGLHAWAIDPGEHGIGVVDPAALAGETPAHNAQIIEEVLAGRGAPGAQAAVLLNAAAAVYVAGQAESYAAAVPQVRAALKDGVGSEALARRHPAVRPPTAPLTRRRLAPKVALSSGAAPRPRSPGCARRPRG